jgi:hypothetical protein
MEEQESPAEKDQIEKSTGKDATFIERLKQSVFLTTEEKWEKEKKKKTKRRRKSPLREYFRRIREKRAYNRFQRRELNRKKKHRKAAAKEERAPWFQNTSIQKFFKKFTKESKPYYYYAETEEPRSEIQKQRKRLIHFTINSTVLFLIAYVVAYVTYQAMVMFVASRFGINSVFYFYEVAFPIGNNSSLWSDFNIILITFSGPFISVILGAYYLFLYVRKEKTKGLTKLFVLWLSFHFLNFFLGAFVGGAITHQGFGYVIEWLFMPPFLRFGLSILFLFGIGVIGYIHTIYFLESSNSLYWTQKYKKNWLIVFGGIFPWAFGSVFLFILKYPFVIPTHENIVVYDTVMYMTFVFFIAPMLVNFNAKPNFDQTVRKARGRRINWIYLVFFVVIMVLFRIGLKDGFSYFVFK